MCSSDLAGRYEYGKDDLQGCKAAESNHDIHQGLVFCYRAFLAPNLNSAEKATAREYLAMLYFGVKEFDEAVVHYDAALALNPRLASSLYGRGVAKLRDGNSAQGATDITAAKTIQANIETVMAGRGISP